MIWTIAQKARWSASSTRMQGSTDYPAGDRNCDGLGSDGMFDRTSRLSLLLVGSISQNLANGSSQGLETNRLLQFELMRDQRVG